MKNMKELINKHTDDEGNINFEAVEEVVNKNTNDIIASKTDEEKLLAKATEKILADAGVDGTTVDDLKLYVKKMTGNTDDIKEHNIKLEKELEALKAERDDFAGKYETVQNEYQTTQQLGKVKSLGVDEEKAEFIHYKVNKMVNDETDFDSALDKFKEENKDMFRKASTTHRRVQGSSADDLSSDDINAAHARKYGKK